MLPVRAQISLTALCLVIFSSSVLAGNHIEVIYPKDGQQIPAVDSTFILGNTEPGANLTINGDSVEVHKGGGFLAFLPVQRGEFNFDLISDYLGDICLTTVGLQVGPPADTSTAFVDPLTIWPPGRTVLPRGETFEFSFKASAEGRGWCSLASDSSWASMYPDEKAGDLASVFGDIPDSDSSWGLGQEKAKVRYQGYLPVNNVQ